MSGWAGARDSGWVREQTASGQWKSPRFARRHPFSEQRKLWLQLSVEFQGVLLVFATPLELDQFLSVMSKNPLPSGRSLFPGRAVGRPNNHWLSRLPSKAKTLKFRTAACRYLTEAPAARRFREFYASSPVRIQFVGFYASHLEAQAAAKNRG